MRRLATRWTPQAAAVTGLALALGGCTFDLREMAEGAKPPPWRIADANGDGEVTPEEREARLRLALERFDVERVRQVERGRRRRGVAVNDAALADDRGPFTPERVGPRVNVDDLRGLRGIVVGRLAGAGSEAALEPAEVGPVPVLRVRF